MASQENGKTIEAFRQGYPRYAALLSSHSNFQVWRRFTRVRARLALFKQDEITRLEEQLDKIDVEERHGLFLGCQRKDTNKERRTVVQELSASLIEYDRLLKECQEVLQYPHASKRDISSLKNWLDGTGCIALCETTYLDQDDLFHLVPHPDEAIVKIETIIEDCLITISAIFGWNSKGLVGWFQEAITEDQHIFVFKGRLKVVSRAFTAWIALIVMLVPVMLLSCVSSMRGKLLITVFAAGVFLFTVSLFSKAKTIEVFAAGAAYTSVLVVYTATSSIV